MTQAFLNEDLDMSKIKKDLNIASVDSYTGVTIYHKLYKENPLRLPLEYATRNNLIKPPVFVPDVIRISDMNINLRDLQKNCMKRIDLQFTKKFGGGVINLRTGAGKTILSLYTIAKYKLKTLIIVHTNELLLQWKSEINKLLPEASVGIIQMDVFDASRDISIGMIQTISRKNTITPDMFAKFGLCFIDECHHISSKVFSETLFKTRVKYVFGLSATPERKDGMDVVIKHHIGEVIFSDKHLGNTKQSPLIKPIYFSSPDLKVIKMYNGKPNYSKMITEISKNSFRNLEIIQILQQLPDTSRALVLSDRLSQLSFLQKSFPETSGMFVGKTPVEEKMIAKKKKILFSTYAMASEGFDHPVLNTLVLATPRSDVIQSVGRIFRKTHETQPLIVDIVDTFGMFQYQYKKRAEFYKSLTRDKEIPETVCEFD